MSETIRIVPIDLKDGIPRDAKLAAALQAYCLKEFGRELAFDYYYRLWVVLLTRAEDPDYYEVIGTSAIRYIPDCPMFHVSAPTKDKEGLRIAEQARDMMVYRLHSYLTDLGHAGSFVLIYVSQTAQRYWRRFLLKIKAEPAERFALKL